MSKRLRILSGVQPSGVLHLGNYFGAIRQHIALQDEGEAFYFIANYHALTTVNDAETLREYTRGVALDYLALGLDPERATFFRQSDVPEVCELTWLLSTVTGMGLLERAVSYKDKVARGIQPRVGLFTYPVLMAADILIYDSDVVPVGADQVQHIEMTRDMAQYFNSTYGEVFKLPDARVEEATAKVPGTDGQKMSKSYGNTISIFDEGKPLKQAVMGIYGYGDAKKRLLASVDAYFAPFRDRRRELAEDPSTVEEIMRAGAERARREARTVLDRARHACGVG